MFPTIFFFKIICYQPLHFVVLVGHFLVSISSHIIAEQLLGSEPKPDRTSLSPMQLLSTLRSPPTAAQIQLRRAAGHGHVPSKPLSDQIG